MVSFVFPTNCEVFGGADDPCGQILVQIDDRTYRRANGEELAAIERSHPGLIKGLPKYLEGDWDAPHPDRDERS